MHLRIVFVLYVLCVSLPRCSFVCVRHSVFYVCVTWCDIDVTISRRRSREDEREEQRPLACTIKQKRRNKIRNLWLWLVCCSLLPTCNFHHRPFAIRTIILMGQYKDIQHTFSCCCSIKIGVLLTVCVCGSCGYYYYCIYTLLRSAVRQP